MVKTSRRYEDYLEAIYNISETKGFARTKDVARELDVRPPSVTEMLKKLQDEGFVNYERYGGVTLTEKGKKTGRNVRNRHETIRKFLELMLVSGKTADTDACRIEHVLSQESVDQIKKFVSFAEKCTEKPKWREYFKTFCRKGIHDCEHAKK